MGSNNWKATLSLPEEDVVDICCRSREISVSLQSWILRPRNLQTKLDVYRCFFEIKIANRTVFSIFATTTLCGRWTKKSTFKARYIRNIAISFYSTHQSLQRTYSHIHGRLKDTMRSGIFGFRSFFRRPRSNNLLSRFKPVLCGVDGHLWSRLLDLWKVYRSQQVRDIEWIPRCRVKSIKNA